MKKRIWNQLKKAVMITAAVGILGTGAVSAAEFEVAELYVPAVGLKPVSYTHLTLPTKLEV